MSCCGIAVCAPAVPLPPAQPDSAAAAPRPRRVSPPTQITVQVFPPLEQAATYVVTGSVQRDGARVRVNVRLMNSRSGEQIWTERYDRPFGDLFALQSEITRSVAERLPGRITEAERQRLAQQSWEPSGPASRSSESMFIAILRSLLS